MKTEYLYQSNPQHKCAAMAMMLMAPKNIIRRWVIDVSVRD
jgi:hypothetical protein